MVERLDEPDESGRMLRLTVDLQKDFSLNQPLSTFALAALDLLDPESPEYALDVVSIIEATLEDPRAVLWAQEHHAKGEAVNAMKAEGIEYEERMELLEDVSWPKPLNELLEATFDMYRQTHPWIADAGLSPKSVVRDMFERAMTFGEFIGFYGLARSEGVVLRYLSDAYKALRQTVPEALANEDLTDLIEWLGEVVRQTDSSLLDEWEELTNPTTEEVAAPTPAGPRRITLNSRAFRVLVRNAMFRRVELVSLHRWAELGQLDTDAGWDAAPLGRGRYGVLRRALHPQHRPGGPRPGPLHRRGAPRLLGGPADHRRPGRQPRLAHHRHRRPRRVRRSRRPGPGNGLVQTAVVTGVWRVRTSRTNMGSADNAMPAVPAASAAVVPKVLPSTPPSAAPTGSTPKVKVR